MPSTSPPCLRKPIAPSPPTQYLAERLGTFAAHVATANPKLVRLVYHGNFPPQNTRLIRNAGLAGVLSRSLAVRANVVNALKLAADRGLSYAERFERPTGHMDSLRIELETDKGVTTVEGAIVMDKPRLLAVDGIRCEATLAGHLIYLTHEDVPGVLGYIGTVTGKNHLNIAALSLGRQEKPDRPGDPLTAITLIETDQPVPEPRDRPVTRKHKPCASCAAWSSGPMKLILVASSSLV